MIRDARFAELDRLIAESDERNSRHWPRGIIGKLERMTQRQKHQHGKRAQKFRVYQVSCECGKCRKCRHRIAKRKYNRRIAAEATPHKPVYPLGEIPHGTFSGYNRHGCRCAACRECVVNRQRRRLGQSERVGSGKVAQSSNGRASESLGGK